MASIFINGINAKAGGGKSILINFLRLASRSVRGHNYIVLAPNELDTQEYQSESVQVITLPRMANLTVMYPIVNRWVLPRLVRKSACELLFNLADIPAPISIPQVFLFDWPYAVYPKSTVWQTMDLGSCLTRKAKLWFFRRYLAYVDLFIAQNGVMKERLEEIYGINPCAVVPNAVSLDNLLESSGRDFKLPDGHIYLCLTHYYPHKNLEILIDVGKEIKARNMMNYIVITIAADQHPAAASLLERVKSEGLDDVIINVGPVTMEDVPDLYRQTDCLLLPTLLESFSGTYVEAMHHERPILTSRLDFASAVCGDAAYYFDPYDANEIIAAMEREQGCESERVDKIEAGRRILANLLTWEEAFGVYEDIFNQTLSGRLRS